MRVPPAIASELRAALREEKADKVVEIDFDGKV